MSRWIKVLLLAVVMAAGSLAFTSSADAQIGVRYYGGFYQPYYGRYYQPYTYYRPYAYYRPYTYSYYGAYRPYYYRPYVYYRPYYRSYYYW